MTSRHRRPAQPLRFQLTTRDHAVLLSVFAHRFLSADHIRQLHFASAGLRVCQARLQRLWAGHYVDRLFLPPEAPDMRDRWLGRPIYSLATRGANVVAAVTGQAVREIPHTPAQNRRGYATLRHHLVFTDFAVAWRASAAGSTRTVDVLRESAIRACVHANRDHLRHRTVLVPDGAVTIHDPALAIPQTLLVEAVRAGMKAGNSTFVRRLHRYRVALREGLFRDIYGLRWVHAVLFLTPTLARARRLANLARATLSGDGLFRFGVYETPGPGPTPMGTLRPDTVTSAQFLTPSLRPVALLPQLTHT